MAIKPYYSHAGIQIFHGDCREILPFVSCDAVITDPPYGVDFTGKVTKHTDNRDASTAYLDTEENFRSVVLPAVRTALGVSKRAAIFCGTRRISEYPPARDLGGIVCPNGGGMSSWGFGCYHPLLLYGNSPYMEKGLGGRPTATVMYHPGMHVTGGDQIDHPCPKPLAFMQWVVGMASLSDHSIGDPFMGSGTTLVAAKNLGRTAWGIEIEEKYCEIAAKRLSQEVFDFGEVR